MDTAKKPRPRANKSKSNIFCFPARPSSLDVVGRCEALGPGLMRRLNDTLRISFRGGETNEVIGMSYRPAGKAGPRGGRRFRSKPQVLFCVHVLPRNPCRTVNDYEIYISRFSRSSSFPTANYSSVGGLSTAGQEVAILDHQGARSFLDLLDRSPAGDGSTSDRAVFLRGRECIQLSGSWRSERNEKISELLAAGAGRNWFRLDRSRASKLETLSPRLR